MRIRQRTALPSTYSDLPALSKTHLYRLWFGFMGAGSIVRGQRLSITLNSTTTGGASSLYDGAPLVGQSVARVCTSSGP
jgi:hypothetical protein